ncbi:prepilin-type N-terminal cleavage/methylation domain-containing protein [Candidatus Peregrinibacteria bacterium]|nr:MAG: prepilin-type N-terminal cleavage/methylation domain-containing protein [Candidatus Peregrinibacteria bacterium]
MNKKGFTLIELMIVIVILGILVGTILPRVTGGQDRARDVAAKIDLTAYAQALELFYNDHGYYPRVGNVANSSYDVECLANANVATAGSVSSQLAPYMKGGRLPASSNTTLNCDGTNTTTRTVAYVYYELNEDSSVNTINQSYAIVADMLLYQNANYQSTNSGTLSPMSDGGRSRTNINANMGPLSAESGNPEQSLYVITD